MSIESEKKSKKTGKKSKADHKARQATEPGNKLESVRGSVMKREVAEDKDKEDKDKEDKENKPKARYVPLNDEEEEAAENTRHDLEAEIETKIISALQDEFDAALAQSEVALANDEFHKAFLEAADSLQEIAFQLRVANGIRLKDEIQNQTPEKQKKIIDNYASFGRDFD